MSDARVTQTGRADDSILVELVLGAAHAFTYTRLYGRRLEEGSDIGRAEAWEQMTVDDVFEALRIVTEPRSSGSPAGDD